MWYEVLPSFAIVTACLLVPPYAMCGINYLLLNGKVSLFIYCYVFFDLESM